MDSDLGAKVKKLRIAHGLTQEDVAKALEVTPGYISNVENGRNLMTLRMLSYYAELTGVSLDYLAFVADGLYAGSYFHKSPLGKHIYIESWQSEVKFLHHGLQSDALP